MRLLIRLLVNAAALWAATKVIPGITHTGSLVDLLVVAGVFGLVNAFVGPILKLLSLPFVVLTLGLFTLVVNGVLLWITSALSGSLGLGFHVSGLLAAILGALVISIVSVVLSIFVAKYD
jgi:putative membrane protein